MGVEHKAMDVSKEALREMAAVLRDYAASFDHAAERMEERNLQVIPVRHVAKGKTSMTKLGEFVEMVALCLRNHMFTTAFPSMVAEEKPPFAKPKKQRPKDAS